MSTCKRGGGIWSERTYNRHDYSDGKTHCGKCGHPKPEKKDKPIPAEDSPEDGA